MATYRSLLAYWSGGAVQPPLTASTSLIEIFKSYTGKIPDAYFGAYTLCATQDGKLLAGLGNRPADTDGALIVEILPDGSARAEKILDEQGVHEMRLFNGKVYVLGSDAMDDWTFGNAYVRDEFGNWAKKRTLPNVIHAFSQAWIGSYWYVGTGAHTGDNATWTGLVFKSNNDGDSWTQLNSPVCDYRVYNLHYKNNILYAGGMTQALYYENYGNAYIYTSANDGNSWSNTNQKVSARARWLEFKNKIICAGIDGTTIVVIDENGSIVERGVPFTLAISNYQYNIFASDGMSLFALSTDGIYASIDGLIWAKFDDSVDQISIFYYLYILALSNSGIDPNVFYINIPGNEISEAIISSTDQHSNIAESTIGANKVSNFDGVIFSANPRSFIERGVVVSDFVNKHSQQIYNANSFYRGIDGVKVADKYGFDVEEVITTTRITRKV